MHATLRAKEAFLVDDGDDDDDDVKSVK